MFKFATALLLLSLNLSRPTTAATFSNPQCSDSRAASATCKNVPLLLQRQAPRGDKYLIGVGKADVTGPIVEVGLAGYGKFEQAGTGLRQRLYSRAFIVADKDRPEDRVVYIVLDELAGDTAIRYGLVEALAALGGEYSVYGQNNIALTATHTHSGPGAWFNYFLLQAPTWGFDKASYQAIVDGALLSIQRAHENLQEGYLDVGTTDIENASINRSPTAYLRNPKEERDKYPTTVDNTMTAIRFQRASDGRNIGILNWFAVHGTSLHNNNTHVAGDNKGVAAWMFEKDMEADDSAAEGFVAGFSQSNAGDVSPNTLGAWCEDGSQVMCHDELSTCPNGKSSSCRARGPQFRALDLGVTSCYEIGRRQFEGAKEIYTSPEERITPVKGDVKAFHFFHDMTYWRFTLPDGSEVSTCPAALGYSTAAGTTDGEGLGGFSQGTIAPPKMSLWSFISETEKSLWTSLFKMLGRPSREQKGCHGAKPILLDAGDLAFPYKWEPSIVDVQMMRIGQVLMAVSPSEITTMSGRRWRDAIAKQAKSVLGENDPIPLVVGPANTYAHYVTTPEEYTAQRYEGSSTMFGPYQLPAFINLTVSNMHYLAAGSFPMQHSSDLPKPPNHSSSSLSLFPGVYFDRAPADKPYGSVIRQPRSTYTRGEVISATFQGANPRNNFRLEETFVAVEKKVGPNSWARVLDDGDWFLVFTWRRTNLIMGYSESDATWETGEDVEPGTYRFKYYGDARRIFKGDVESFEGTSGAFDIQ